MGTYQVTFMRESGNCGDPPMSGVYNLGADAMLLQTQGCKTEYAMLSEGGCLLTDVISCPDPSGYKIISEGSAQLAADGSQLDGEAAVWTGACTGTYGFTAIRQ
jgi:hypothetical protein